MSAKEVSWNQLVYLNFETLKHSYSRLEFREEAAYTNTDELLELYRKRA
jgi:hypothetical protein